MKISAVIAVYNEEKNIERCLRSVSFADEIIVVDSYSTDKTVRHARKFTEKIYYRKFNGFSDIKNYGISKAKYPWILSIDADEEVTAALRKILRKKTEGREAPGFYIKRETFFLGKIIKHCGWGNDYQLRLFRKAAGRFNGAAVHEAVSIKGKAFKIEAPILHYSYPNSRVYFEKMNRYTTLQALEKQKSFLLLRMLAVPAARFFKMFFLKAGFLDGRHGFILSCYSAFSDFIKFAKMREEKKRKGADILILRAPNWLGDAVVSTALMPALAKKYRKICVVADRSVSEVFRNNPYVHDLLEFDRKLPSGMLAAAIRLRRYRAGAAITLTPSASSGFMLLLSGAGVRAGFSDDGIFLNRKYNRDKKHQREHILEEFKKICYLANPFLDFYGLRQAIYPDKKEEKRIIRKFGERGPGKIIVLAPFVRFGPAKMWPVKNYEALAEELLKKIRNAKIFLAGTAGDRKYTFKKIKGVTDLRGRTSTAEIFVLIKNSGLFAGNDSGLMHVADAFKVPLAGIFSSTSAFWTGPLSRKSKVIKSGAECSPCFKEKCRYGHYECMKGITVEKVLKISLKLLLR